MDRSTRRFGIALGIVLALSPAVVVPVSLFGQPPGTFLSPDSPFNRSLADIRRASSSWERRQGPDRRVVDMVCLVPDLATFLEAIAAWDEGHFFPILIDDVELTFK